MTERNVLSASETSELGQGTRQALRDLSRRRRRARDSEGVSTGPQDHESLKDTAYVMTHPLTQTDHSLSSGWSGSPRGGVGGALGRRSLGGVRDVPWPETIEAHPLDVGIRELTATHVLEDVRHGHRDDLTELVTVQVLLQDSTTSRCRDLVPQMRGIAGQPGPADQSHPSGTWPGSSRRSRAAASRTSSSSSTPPPGSSSSAPPGPGRNCRVSTMSPSAVRATTATVRPPSRMSQPASSPSGMA